MNDAADAAYRGTLHRATRELASWHARAVPEAALEPDLPIVDAHHHLYGSAADAHHWRLADLAEDFAGGHRVVATVYVEAYESGWYTTGPEALRPVGEVESIARLTREPLRLPRGPCALASAIVSHVDLTLGDAVASVLEAQLAVADGRLRGVRHVANHDAGVVGRFLKPDARPHLLSETGFRRGFARLAAFGLGYDAWVYHPQLRELRELADAFPEIPIVINHVGGLIGVGEYRADRARHLAAWRAELAQLARRPNVAIKVGGLGMPVFGLGFEHADRPPASDALARAWQPLIDACLDTFGAGRCMLESNFPVDKQSCGYTVLWNALKIATRALSHDERAALFAGTARRVYRLAH